jgi:alpha-tubulin suppressor-like RCC1 family protein
MLSSKFFKSESPHESAESADAKSISFKTKWKDYRITDTASIFLDYSGNVWVHGCNSNHSLGLSNQNPEKLLFQAEKHSKHYEFQQNPHLKNIKKILAGDGERFCFFEDKKDHVWVMGNSFSGQAGIGKMVTAKEGPDYTIQAYLVAMTMPTEIPDLKASDIQKMICSKQTSFILTKKGIVLACGANDEGQLGLGHTENCAKFTLVPELKDVKDIIAKNRETYFILKDGRRLACGNNQYGELGLKEKPLANFCALPKEMFGKVQKIVSHRTATFFLTEENEVFMSSGNMHASPYQSFVPDNKEECINAQKTILSNVNDIQCGHGAVYILSQKKVFAIGSGRSPKEGPEYENLEGDFSILSPVPKFENISKLCVASVSHIVGLTYDGRVLSTNIQDAGKKLKLDYSGKVKDIAVGSYYTILTLQDDSIIGFSLKKNIPDWMRAEKLNLKEIEQQQKEIVYHRPRQG